MNLYFSTVVVVVVFKFYFIFSPKKAFKRGKYKVTLLLRVRLVPGPSDLSDF